jgi:transposase-like protein
MNCPSCGSIMEVVAWTKDRKVAAYKCYDCQQVYGATYLEMVKKK